MIDHSNSKLLRSSLLGILYLLIISSSVNGQEILSIDSHRSLNWKWMLLVQDHNLISSNDSLNEHLVDLVNVAVTDSVLRSKSQRHRVAEAGWIISIVGYKWRALDMVKQKFVGTERDGIRVPGNPPFFTEYDVNFNLIPHTRRYIDLVWKGYEFERNKNRFKHIKDFDKAPWVYPKTLKDINHYRMHCELTPPEAFRPMLNEKFYPCIRPNSSREHINIGTDHATFGMYGAFVADCNHDCHPEIHPYDWIWWYDLHPDRSGSTAQTWFFGLMKESSNRFRGWYRKKESRVGRISVPFIFNMLKDTFRITLEHLVHGTFDHDGLAALVNMPDSASDLYFSEKDLTFENSELKGKVIRFVTSDPIKQEGMKYWFSSLNFDKEKNLLSGYLNLGVAVDKLYNAKVSFESGLIE